MAYALVCFLCKKRQKNLQIRNISFNFVSVADIARADISSDNTRTSTNATRMNTSNNALTEAVYYILLSVLTPMHGYGIMQKTAAFSGGRLVISAGTLYGALSSLLDKGWIEQIDTPADSRKKEYLITAEGRRVVEQELERLRELVSNGESILTNN